MPIFGIKPKKKEKDSARTALPAAPTGAFDSSVEAIIRPHVTEKSGVLSQSGTYTFQVSRFADKASVARAVRNLYKVTPVKVAMITIPAKNVMIRGKKGKVSGIRKALVTVKKGDKIDFV